MRTGVTAHHPRTNQNDAIHRDGCSDLEQEKQSSSPSAGTEDKNEFVISSSVDDTNTATAGNDPRVPSVATPNPLRRHYLRNDSDNNNHVIVHDCFFEDPVGIDPEEHMTPEK